MHPFAWGVVDLEVHIPELRGCVVVDLAALAGANDRVAVGIEDIAVDGHAQFSPHVRGEEIELGRAAAAVLSLDVERLRRRRIGDEVNHSTHRVIAIEAGAGTIDDLDALRALHWNPRPIHPAAKRIVVRHAVDEHERAADPAWSDPTQGNALRRRMRCEAARSSKQTERWNLAEKIVRHEGR